jgi:hypothetical protein
VAVFLMEGKAMLGTSSWATLTLSRYDSRLLTHTR